MQTTEQFAWRRDHFVEEKYQHVKSQEQTTKVTEQWELQTSQAVAQTFQTRKVDTKVWKTEEQWNTAKSQSVQTTTQYVMEVDQYKLGRRQVFKHQYQTIAKIGDDEIGVARTATASRPAASVARPGYLPQPARRSEHLSTGPGATVGPGPGFLKTTCIDGPWPCHTGPVASCTRGSLPPLPATAGSRRLAISARRADPVQRHVRRRAADPGRGVLHLHLLASAAPTTRSNGVASCGADIPGTAPDWITTTCTQPPGPTNFAATPSLPCAVGPRHRRQLHDDDLHEAGRHAGIRGELRCRSRHSPPYLKVTCLPPEVISDDAVASASCTPGTVGLVTTTCTTTAGGPVRRADAGGDLRRRLDDRSSRLLRDDLHQSAGDQPDRLHDPRACGAPGVTVGTAPDWITSDCRKPAGANNDTVFADPRFCINDPGPRSRT